MNINRGMFILLEGPDKCGKDTLLTNLIEKYQPSKVFHFPNEEIETGRKLRQYLNKEIQLTDEQVNKLFAEDRKNTLQDIVNCLKQGTNVFCSRYAFSGVAYTTSKGILTMERAMLDDLGILKPDLVILLYSFPREIKSRYNSSDRYETVVMQNKVLEVYKTMMAGYDGLWIDFCIGDRTPLQVLSDVDSLIQSHIKLFMDELHWGLFENVIGSCEKNGVPRFHVEPNV